MAYLLVPGERIGQLVYPGEKQRAFANDEIELALGGRGYTKIAAGRVRQFNDVPHLMLVAAAGGDDLLTGQKVVEVRRSELAKRFFELRGQLEIVLDGGAVITVDDRGNIAL
jgi:hypothetical protein